MKLTHLMLTTPIDLSIDQTNVLQIEDVSCFRSLVENAVMRADGNEDDGFQLSSDGKLLDFSKDTVVLLDYFHLDSAYKKLSQKLYKKLDSAFMSNAELQTEYQITVQQLLSLVRRVGTEVDVAIDHSFDVPFPEILKLFGVCVTETENTLFGRLEEYVNAISEFSLAKLLVCVNAKCYLKVDELEELFKLCKYKKIELLLIEHFDGGKKLPSERRTILDCDLCEFVI